MNVIIIFLSFFFLALIIVLFIVVTYDILRTDVPMIFSKKAALQKFFNEYHFPENSVLLDIGSGDGRVIKAFCESYTKLSAKGIEKAYIPFIISLFTTRHCNAKIFRADIFSERGQEIAGKATHIFVYLQPEMLQKLDKLFEASLEKGITILSLDFELSSRKASHTVVLEKSASNRFYEFGKVVYIYN